MSTTNLIVTDEVLSGNPSMLEMYLQKELANMILNMDYKTVEETCFKMRLLADVFEILEEHINEEHITFKYNPMGYWYLVH